MGDYEHELISIDDQWRKDTTDAVAAQLREAGIKVKRTVLPGSTFWNDWAKYPFSSTNWNHRPLGVQILALAYRSGEKPGTKRPSPTRSSTAFWQKPSPLLMRTSGGWIMAKIEKLMQDEGVIIQPYLAETLQPHQNEPDRGRSSHHLRDPTGRKSTGPDRA